MLWHSYKCVPVKNSVTIWLQLFELRTIPSVQGSSQMQIRESGQTVPTEERRRWPRLPIDGETSITVNLRGQEYRCSLLDISLGGAKLRFQEEPPIHSNISLDHPGMGIMAGNCVWRNLRDVGVRFHEFPAGRRTAHICP